MHLKRSHILKFMLISVCRIIWFWLFLNKMKKRLTNNFPPSFPEIPFLEIAVILSPITYFLIPAQTKIILASPQYIRSTTELPMKCSLRTFNPFEMAIPGLFIIVLESIVTLRKDVCFSPPKIRVPRGIYNVQIGNHE